MREMIAPHEREKLATFRAHKMRSALRFKVHAMIERRNGGILVVALIGVFIVGATSCGTSENVSSSVDGRQDVGNPPTCNRYPTSQRRLDLVVGLGNTETNAALMSLHVSPLISNAIADYDFIGSIAEGERCNLISQSSQSGRIGTVALSMGFASIVRTGTRFDATANWRLPIGVCWIPWCAELSAMRLGISPEIARRALSDAKAGRRFDQASIDGSWVYEQFQCLGQESERFTEVDLLKPEYAVDVLNRIAVTVKVRDSRAEDFHRFSIKYMGRPICLVIDGELVHEAIITEPMTDGFQLNAPATDEGVENHERAMIHVLDRLSALLVGR